MGRRRRRPSASGRAPRDPTRCRATVAGRPDRPPGPAERAAVDAADPARREDAGSPRRAAAIIVADTVVAAQPPAASAAAEARPGRLADGPGGAVPRASRSSSARPDQEPPVADGHGGRHGAALADRRLRRAGDLEVLRVRQAVADQRRFERDDRAPGGQRVRDLRRDGQTIGDGIDRWSQPSSAPGRGAASWRAAARWPTRAARWSAAGGDRPRPAHASQPTRNPRRTRRRHRSCRPPSSGAVATSNRDGRAARRRPGQDRRARRAALDRRRSARARAGRSTVASAEQRLGLDGGREQHVRRDVRGRSAQGRAPAVGQQRPDRREVQADASPRRPGQLDRPPAGQPERLAEQRIRRQVDEVGAGEPRRARGRPARARSAAPRSATKRPLPARRDEDPDPAGPRARRRARRGRDPVASSASTQRPPAARRARPRRPASVRAPSRAEPAGRGRRRAALAQRDAARHVGARSRAGGRARGRHRARGRRRRRSAALGRGRARRATGRGRSARRR